MYRSIELEERTEKGEGMGVRGSLPSRRTSETITYNIIQGGFVTPPSVPPSADEKRRTQINTGRTDMIEDRGKQSRTIPVRDNTTGSGDQELFIPEDVEKASPFGTVEG